MLSTVLLETRKRASPLARQSRRRSLPHRKGDRLDTWPIDLRGSVDAAAARSATRTLSATRLATIDAVMRHPMTSTRKGFRLTVTVGTEVAEIIESVVGVDAVDVIHLKGEWLPVPLAKVPTLYAAIGLQPVLSYLARQSRTVVVRVYGEHALQWCLSLEASLSRVGPPEVREIDIQLSYPTSKRRVLVARDTDPHLEEDLSNARALGDESAERGLGEAMKDITGGA